MMDSNNRNVRPVWLVGESLPLTKAGTKRKARKAGQLEECLVSLDPRHGVFPNLVMKPLFAATYAAFRESESSAVALLRALEAVLCDDTERRFNLFQPKVTNPKDPESNRFIFDSTKLERRVNEFSAGGQLWLVFGHQTVSGLLMWLLDNKPEASREELQKFLEEFVSSAFAVKDAAEKCTFSFPSIPPSSGTARIGFFHRLCTEYDHDGSGASFVLKNAVVARNICRTHRTEFVVEILRALVPLMHNEAYQDGRNPTGNAQAHFVQYATNKGSSADLYWQVMGRSVARRCFGRWVGQPALSP